MTYDYLIVGAGLFGATFAQQATEHGKTCLVIDSRNHVAGNCHTERREGIDVHVYGPHLFHTSSKKIWDYVNRFTEFNGYHHQVVAQTARGNFSLPINLHTLDKLFGVNTPSKALDYFESVRNEHATADNFEDYCLYNVGRELYELFFYGYAKKHWGREPKLLPSSIIKRLPIRLDWNNRYFSDTYEGIPVDGYTTMVDKMLYNVPVSLNTTFEPSMRKMAKHVVYSGSLDKLYNNVFGKLDYRSIKIEHSLLHISDYQGIGQMNFNDWRVPWTRIVEPRHFMKIPALNHTIISREFSTSIGEPYYPIEDETNKQRFEQYKQLAIEDDYIFGGRLGAYRYMDMHQVIGMALMMSERELKGEHV